MRFTCQGGWGARGWTRLDQREASVGSRSTLITQYVDRPGFREDAPTPAILLDLLGRRRRFFGD